MPSIKYTTVHVTQPDIDRALKRDSARCVIATAIPRSIEGAHRVSVDLQTIRFTKDGERFVYLTPPAAQGYVVAFDRGDDIHPFGFRLSEDHRVNVRQDKRTEAGKEQARVRVAAETARKRVTEASKALASATTDTERAAADANLALASERAERAERDRVETNQRLAGQPHHEPDLTPDPETGKRKRKSPPRAYRRNVREFGVRTLAINQNPDDDRESARGVTAAYDVYAGED